MSGRRKGGAYDERRKRAHAHQVSYVGAGDESTQERNGREGVNRGRLDYSFDEAAVAREVEHRA